METRFEQSLVLQGGDPLRRMFGGTWFVTNLGLAAAGIFISAAEAVNPAAVDLPSA